MKSLPHPLKRQSGQILPVALAGFVAALLCFSFLVKAGSLLVQRERARMRTDLTAYSIGVDYARALNVLAMTEKMVSVGHVASFIPFVGASARAMVQFLQRVQKGFLTFGPWLNEASAAYLGTQNGLVAVPLWNTRDLIQDFEAQSFLPSYNVLQRGLAAMLSEELSKLLKTEVSQATVRNNVRDLEEAVKKEVPAQSLSKLQSLIKKSLPSLNLDWLLKKTGYSYQPKKGGERIYVRQEEGTTQAERKAGGGSIVRSHDNGSGKKVHVEKGLDLDLPVDLAESGEHFITLIAPLVPSLEPLARPEQPWLWSIAQVQVDGGDMDTFSMHSAQYQPHLVPVRMSLDFFPAQAPQEQKPPDLDRVRKILGRLPFDLERLPGGAYLQNVLDILDIQH